MAFKLKPLLKPGAFVLCLIPLALIVIDGLGNRLGANPIEAITHRTGDWALRLLLLTLAVTPLRRLFNWNWVMRLRRILGLYAFFYALLHFLTWLVLDQFFAWDEIVKDIVKRPYITIGFAAFVLLIPLAITSTDNMIRRLGPHWQRLHQLVYVIAVGAILHYLWLVKADTLKPLIHAGILLLLLTLRVWFKRRAGTRRRALAASGP